MTGFWYPYADFSEAQGCLSRFAKASVGAGCGISFSDGQSMSVVQQAAGEHVLWLNVLAQHVAAPPPPPPLVRHWYSETVDFFEESIRAQYEGGMAVIEDQVALRQKIIDAVDTHVWQPTHTFLLHHKLIADGIGVAVDVVGVVAGVAFVVAAAPELMGGAAIIGTIGLITGGIAAVGSFILLFVDGRVFGAELSGDAKNAAELEDSRWTQWMRVVGTVMTLPDVAVGGVHTLQEIGVLSKEAHEAEALTKTLTTKSEAQRLRIQKIHNPKRHPQPVQYHANRARKLAKMAAQHIEEARRAHARIWLLTLRDANASFVATPVGTGLFAALPPSMVLSPEQRERDENRMALLAPKGGMPKDIRLEMRVSSITRAPL